MIVHWTHKAKMRTMFSEGFSIDEIALAYKTTYWRVKTIVASMTPPERI